MSKLSRFIHFFTNDDEGNKPFPGILRTVTGNPIHITDALAKPVQALSIALEPVQDLHGYDNPWPAGGGKNKFAPVTDGTYESNGIKIVAKNGVLTFSGTSTASGNISIPFDATQTFPSSDDFDFCLLNSFSNANISMYLRRTGADIHYWTLSVANRKVTSWTSSADETFDRIVFSFASGVSASGTVSPMLVKKNEANKSTFAPYSNICPISGHTDADVIVSPTLNPLDGTTYPIPLGQTVYGGTLDVLTGVLTVMMAMVDLGTLTWGEAPTGGTNKRMLSTGLADVIKSPATSSIKADIICETYPTITADQVYTEHLGISVNYLGTLCAYDPGLQTASAFTTAMSGVQLCYELATPTTIQLTPTQVELLQGENNIWSDGTMTLTYLADGNASEIEALNILLGGRYVNNHGEDEPTDREALDILLGRR